MGTATVQAQHVAERLGLPVEKVAFEYGDTALPAGTLAGGSSQTASTGAVIAAYDALVQELFKLAGNDPPLAGLKPDDVEARDGGLCKLGEPGRCESYVSILARSGREEVARCRSRSTSCSEGEASLKRVKSCATAAAAAISQAARDLLRSARPAAFRPGLSGCAPAGQQRRNRTA